MPLPVRYVESEDPNKKTATPASPTAQQQPNSDTPDGDSLPKAASLPILDAVLVPSNRLQALGVHNISTVIRQLSSIAKHAESIMGDLADVMLSYHQRTVQLEERTRRLREEVLSNLNPEREASEGFEIPHPDFHFRSDRHIDQHLLSKQHIPQPLVEQIKAAHTPPLYLFTPYIDGGKNAMHLYSNPDFFFEHWRNSMKKEAMRRKSTVDVLSPVGTREHSKTNGSVRSPRSHTHHSKPYEGSRPLKRNTKLSKSFHGRAKSHHFGSNLSLQEAGNKSPPKSSSLSRSYSMRASKRPGAATLKYAGSVRGKSRSKAHGFVRVTAANFTELDLKLAVPATEDVRPTTAVDHGRNSSPGPGRDEKGGFFHRTLSFRHRAHSRSRSPNPPIPAESIFTGTPMYTLDAELKRQQKYPLSVLSKQHLENLDLGSADFQTCLYTDNAKKVSSTFKTSVIVSSRPITPMIPRIPTPTLTAPPKTAPKRIKRSSSDVKQRNFQRSQTISGHNMIRVKKTSRDDLKFKDVRPASVALEQLQVYPQARSDSQPCLRAKTLSQASLGLHSVSVKARQESISPPNKRHSTALLYDSESASTCSSSTVTTQESVGRKPTITATTQNKPRPRRPAPARPSSDDKRPGSKESASPAVSTPNSSPIPGPPPPPRNDSLSNLRNQNDLKNQSDLKQHHQDDLKHHQDDLKSQSDLKHHHHHQDHNETVISAGSGSGPATPGTAHAAQRHSTLDSQRKESVANAISNVLSNIARRNLQSPQDEHHPYPLSPVGLASPTGMTRSGGGIESPISPVAGANLNAVLSPVSPIAGAKAILSPMSPIAGARAVLSPDLNDSQLRAKRASLKRQSSKPKPLLIKQESLYISPRKLSLVNNLLSPPSERSFNRSGEILRAGGVVDAEEEQASGRSSLLAAIRKGLQLRKVDEVAPERERDEANPWDVAAILERYQVLHSDSEGSESEIEWDDLDEIA